MTRQDYVDKYKEWAIKEMQNSGIPASITLAQGILESDCGNSRLAVNANNHFGIKCHSDWKGEKIYHDDDRDQECFRKYNSASESFHDHTYFLVTKSRYQSLFTLKSTDYKGWAKGLKAAGYATDPAYATRLIDIIEDLELYKLDYDIKNPSSKPKTEVAQNTSTSTSKKTSAPSVKNNGYFKFEINPLGKHETSFNNGVRYIRLREGDSIERIAVEFHLQVSDILRYNDLKGDEDISSMRYIYINAKRNRAHRDCPTHVVKGGETLWSISQKYGIKLKKLARRNNLSETDKLKSGMVLNLR
ncbi:MAG: glucosaminidase domain-containing protein [Bacteroidia bacterium]|nr:glucosaminidase domain-containing protein [Bacteroidia bacterium]